jgi:2-polyprenyl-3-methyl-5-hydroxy-6-metoxy-1,4-benzoquinol methylase
MDTYYHHRKLADGYPELGRLAHEYFVGTQTERPAENARMDDLLRLLGRLVPLTPGQNVCVIGCGPVPQIMRYLGDRGFTVTGIEPVESFVASANTYLGSDSVKVGAAESIPLPSESQHVLFFESVLEHVDSPLRSLQEIYRVLVPGGIVFVQTTNRLRFSLTGANGEYNVRYYNWLPRLVKESYVFLHLHYRPSLANYTERPAVHWFSYTDLCALGREVGFAQFYSPLDLRRSTDQPLTRNPIKRAVMTTRALERIQRSPWLRSLALTQLGHDVIMLKRSNDYSSLGMTSQRIT